MSTINRTTFLMPSPVHEIPHFELQCTACRRTFKRPLQKLYMDVTTYEKNRDRNQPHTRSEFVVPERVVCPKCQAIDQYQFLPFVYLYVALVGSRVRSGSRKSNEPLRLVRFTLADGTPMHPLDALEEAARQVREQPDRADLRLAYATLLEFLGYDQEAVAQRQVICDQDLAAAKAPRRTPGQWLADQPIHLIIHPVGSLIARKE